MCDFYKWIDFLFKLNIPKSEIKLLTECFYDKISLFFVLSFLKLAIAAEGGS